MSLLLVHVIEVRTGVFMWSWCNFEFEVCLSGYCSNSQVLRATCMVRKATDAFASFFHWSFRLSACPLHFGDCLWGNICIVG